MTTYPAARFDHARELVHEYLSGESPPEPLRRLLDALLGGIRELDQERSARERRLERTQLECETDVVTGLLNRFGWQRRLEREEDRARRFGEFGDPVAVLSVRLASAADGHRLALTARVLRDTLRPGDPLARLDGAEFAALLAGASPAAVAELVGRVRAVLPGHATVSWAPLVSSAPLGSSGIESVEGSGERSISAL
jgi:GGDEF domain-containing protein